MIFLTRLAQADGDARMAGSWRADEGTDSTIFPMALKVEILALYVNAQT
jgi:hypothetical protein